ncbi:MAG TPA: hypothetical protein VMB05_00395 [Solirubrobacteraceae bacterium]|nr:hypothetical protein [Solirubrobacteraceae bacterium]
MRPDPGFTTRAAAKTQIPHQIRHQVSTESIESIASQPPLASADATCAACGAPLAGDQRYCLQCGERTMPMSSVLAGGASQAAPASPTSQVPPGIAPPTPRLPGSSGDDGRGNALTVIAGVGVLLLAMGIGVLIGRSTSSKPSAASAAPQVITVGSTAGAGTTPAASEAFTGDWPAGSGGYTVQLESLPAASTQVSAVQSAKSAAEGKGAKQVGALKSDEFPGMTAGNYVIYSGKYTKKAEAEKALPGLKKSFPGASVLQVGSGSAKSSGSGGSSNTSSGGTGKGSVGSSPSNPAPPSVVEDLHKSKGKSYEEKSKNLPDVISTG